MESSSQTANDAGQLPRLLRDPPKENILKPENPSKHLQHSSEHETLDDPNHGPASVQPPATTPFSSHDWDKEETSRNAEPNETQLLLNIPGVTESPQTVETLIEIITKLCEKEANSPDAGASKIEILDALGNALGSFSRNHPSLNDKIVACRHQAALLTPNGHPDKLHRLQLLGQSLWSRIKIQTSLPDIDRAIECYLQILEICRDEDSARAKVLELLATLHAARYEQTEELGDLNEAIELGGQAVAFTQDPPRTKVHRLSQLGMCYRSRFHRSGTLEDINKAIEYHAQAVVHLKDGDDDRVMYLGDLGTAFRLRFKHLGTTDDFEQAIECFNLATESTPTMHEDKHRVFDELGALYRNRFERLGKLEDIESAIKYHKQAIQDIPQDYSQLPWLLISFGTSRALRFGHLCEVDDINEAIAYAARAVALIPKGNNVEKRAWLSHLGNSHRVRFMHLGDILDIDKAVEYDSQAVLLTPDNHIDKPRWLNNLGGSYFARFRRLGVISDLNKAIECQAQGVKLMPDEHPDKPLLLNNLGSSYGSRFDCLHHLPDIDQAIEYQLQAVQLAPTGHAKKEIHLCLGNSYNRRFAHLGQKEDIDNAIECHRQAVLIIPEGNIGRPRALGNLGNSHRDRFDRLKKDADINEAIEYHTQAVSLIPEGHGDKSELLFSLAVSYQRRFNHLGASQDIQQAVYCFEQAATNCAGIPSIRFEAAKRWAQSTHFLPDTSSLPAYSMALKLVPEVVWLGTTIDHRYDDVFSIRGIAAEAAAAAISAKEYSLALEWLEEGRSIVWRQTQQLRSPLDELAAIDPLLGQRLKQLSQNLETASLRQHTYSSETNEQTFEVADRKHRSFAKQYENLLSQIRVLSGFTSCLQPRKATEIMQVARSGPVVIINVHSTRCDALALLPGDHKIAHIPLPNLSQGDVTGLRAQMEESLRSNDLRERRVYRAGERDRDHFETILATLWHKIAEPVLDFLGCTENRFEHQLSHITWCTTGDLSFLPIHAAGCYDPSQLNIFDLAISSYTPTLGALLSSSSQSTATVTGILTVSQEASKGYAPLPGTKRELAFIQCHAKALTHEQLQGQQATIAVVLEAMEAYDSVHLACHASQDIDNLTESGFLLHDGTLTLAEIAKKSFKDKRLAFLSACQTAAGDKKLPDEAVHLAAGMMAAGYPSVIATMWSIKDDDAPLIADHVYAQLLQDGDLGSTGGVAKALHSAVGALRAEVGEKMFARWVPYIHMGV